MGKKNLCVDAFFATVVTCRLVLDAMWKTNLLENYLNTQPDVSTLLPVNNFSVFIDL